MVAVVAQIGARGERIDLHPGNVLVAVENGRVAEIQWPASDDAAAVLGLIQRAGSPDSVRLLHGDDASKVFENGKVVGGSGLIVPVDAIRQG